VYLDALTIAALRDELDRLLHGGRVQRIVQPSELSIGLEVYAGQRYQFLASAEPRSPRVLLVRDRLRRGMDRPSPMWLLLTKYLRGARLESVRQPELERVLHLTFTGEHGTVHLVCEMMGRYSNVILVSSDGFVMGAVKRVPASLNRYRVTLPNHPYVPPPPQEKAHPLLLTPGDLLAMPAEGPLWRRLVNGVLGISPLVAREIVHRATGDAERGGVLAPGTAAAVVQATVDLMRLTETRAWTPCVALSRERGVATPAAYAAYDLTHWPEREPAAGISAAMARVFDAAQPFDAYRQARGRLHALIDEQIRQQEARLASLRRSLVPVEEIEAVQAKGQAILGMAWAIRPGQEALEIDPADWGLQTPPEGGTVRIPLDPALTPSENAQELFRTYRKMRAAAQGVPDLIARGEADLAYLRQVRSEADLAEDRPQLDEAERELQEAGLLPRRAGSQRPSAPAAPLGVRAPDGTLILVGRSSRQNDEVTFRRGSPDDLWLHAHGVPGGHVIVKSGGAPVDEGTLLEAARLAAYYSAARHEVQALVDVTERRHVRHIKVGRPGMVTYSHEQTITVSPAAEGDWEEDEGPDEADRRRL
jgi:predicted ribosome quality control (RQC) complex YloA/Tae2 family protein